MTATARKALAITLAIAAHRSGLPPNDDNATTLADAEWRLNGFSGVAPEWVVNSAYQFLVESDNRT